MTALNDGLLTHGSSVFDYGCGRGDDLTRLEELGFSVQGWDPAFRPTDPRDPADIVNLGYVVNVIESIPERAETLKAAWELTRQILVVSARLTWESRDLAGRPFGDGLVTHTGTFQKLYEQQDLAEWITATLGVPPVAAAPGIFYLFRDAVRMQEFLESRIHRYRPRLVLSPQQAYETHREALAPLLTFLDRHGRPPRRDELSATVVEALGDAVGSIGRGIAVLRQVTDPAYWEEVAMQRRAELVTYIALSRFSHRPRERELGLSLRRDIRVFYGTYRDACRHADRLLAACGDPTMVLFAGRASPVGKQTPTAVYVHRSALGLLPPMLQVYEGCARALAGDVEGANLIKLVMGKPQVSYLCYPAFDRDPHPTLQQSVTVNLSRLSVDYRSYSKSVNPPLLHRKEEFLASDHPRRALYARLTRAEMRANLYSHPELIGTLAGWQSALEQAKVRLNGHRLLREDA